MSEHEDLIGIYGAIDRAVLDNPLLAATVGRYLPGYSDGGAIGWFNEFEAWTLERVEVSPFPAFDAAISHLAELPTSGRMAARRILVVAVAARLRNHLLGPDSSVSIESALDVDGIIGDSTEALASLAPLLVDDGVFASIDDWQQLIETGVDNGLLSVSLRVQAAAPPCVGEVVPVSTPGDPSPAAELTTDFSTTAVTFAQASRFLEPSNWPSCSSFWCMMYRVATTPRNTGIYHEIVSLDCAHPGMTWTAEAYLECVVVKLPPVGAPTGARLSYALSDQYPNTLIKVDEGSITIEERGGVVHVHTVKRIKFSYPFSSQMLAMVMCALGYGSIAAHIVLDCGVQNKDEDNAGTSFRRLLRPPAEPDQRVGTPRMRKLPVGDLVPEAVDKVKECIDNCAAAYTAMYEKMTNRGYSADDLVADAADMWSRYLREGAVIGGLAMKMARAVREPDAGEPAADAPMSGG
jgi:hypothetical protein